MVAGDEEHLGREQRRLGTAPGLGDEVPEGVGRHLGGGQGQLEEVAVQHERGGRGGARRLEELAQPPEHALEQRRRAGHALTRVVEVGEDAVGGAEVQIRETDVSDLRHGSSPRASSIRSEEGRGPGAGRARPVTGLPRCGA